MNDEVKEFVTTEAEAEDLKEFIRKMGEEKGIDNFFLEIIRDKDSLKVGNLTDTELGTPKLPLRTLVDLTRDCSLVPSLSSMKDSFEKQTQSLIASSLSKEGFLIKARITQKKELVDKDKRKQRRKGLFGRKEEEE